MPTAGDSCRGSNYFHMLKCSVTLYKVISLNFLKNLYIEDEIMKSNLYNFSLLTVSTLIMAAGIYFFKFANNFTFGGIL